MRAWRDRSWRTLTSRASQAVEAGAFTPPGAPPNGPAPAAYKALPTFCRVAGSIKPSSDSDIQFEVWLPASGWNGVRGGRQRRLRGRHQLRRSGGVGDAAGTSPPPPTPDIGRRRMQHGRWAIRRISSISAIAPSTRPLAAKAISSLLRRVPRAVLLQSCSNGGRQALMEAQRYPDDYDGIIAGAPANYWTHFAAASWVMQASMADPLLHPGFQADGHRVRSAGCLRHPRWTERRLDRQIPPLPLRPRRSPVSRRRFRRLPHRRRRSRRCGRSTRAHGLPGQIFPGFVSAASPGWADGAAGSLARPGKEPAVRLRYQLFPQHGGQRSGLGLQDFNRRDTEERRTTTLAPVLNATDPDLSKFKSRGGKLILYHGWSDAAIDAAEYDRLLQQRGCEMGARKPRNRCACTWFRACSTAAEVPDRAISDRAGRPPGMRITISTPRWSAGWRRARRLPDHRHEVQIAGQRRAHATVVPLPADGQIQGMQHGRRCELRVQITGNVPS